jgi:hypothetical protein
MFIFTACVWIGIVMISMMISTSITSISGVVLMSHHHVVVARRALRSLNGTSPVTDWEVAGDESDLRDACPLAGHPTARRIR